MDSKIAEWNKQLAPFRGRRVFTQHQSFVYFLDWAGLVVAGEMEPRPGVTPTPGPLAELVGIARQQGVGECLVENSYDTKSTDDVARHSSAKVVVVPGDVGADPGATSYADYFNEIVSRVVAGLQRVSVSSLGRGPA